MAPFDIPSEDADKEVEGREEEEEFLKIDTAAVDWKCGEIGGNSDDEADNMLLLVEDGREDEDKVGEEEEELGMIVDVVEHKTKLWFSPHAAIRQNIPLSGPRSMILNVDILSELDVSCPYLFDPQPKRNPLLDQKREWLWPAEAPMISPILSDILIYIIEWNIRK